MDNIQGLNSEVLAVGKLHIVNQILNIICKTTGMGFAAVARVTSTDWVACAVKDEINFGLQAGGTLELSTTICNEIQNHYQAVVIDDVATDTIYRDHSTPRLYGFRSYISVPIFRLDQSFFGTLCAIDPNPARLNTPEIIDMFTIFAQMIAIHLDAGEQLASNKLSLNVLEATVRERTASLETANDDLQKMNRELLEFNYIASHDLQEPLRKIQTFISIIRKSSDSSLSAKDAGYFDKITLASERMRALINDLLAYSVLERAETNFSLVDLSELIEDVISGLRDESDALEADISVSVDCTLQAIPFQLKQLFSNLVGNSLKYASDERRAKIEISSRIVSGAEVPAQLSPAKNYCAVAVRDNGIGFEQQYAERIFEVFQRLHSAGTYSGTGIGLAIVKKIVDNHKGAIRASGSEDSGATFEIFLPL